MDIGPSRGNRGPVSQINVTPFVDVMLVLLIIFKIGRASCRERV